MNNCLDFYRNICDKDLNYHVDLLSEIALNTLKKEKIYFCW